MSEEDDYTFFKKLEKRLFESGVCKIVIPDGETDTPVHFLKKFKEITHVLTQDPFACDAKWSLFVTAANSFNAKVNVMPYLPKFITSQEHLLFLISETPKLFILLSYAEEYNYLLYEKNVILLIYWVIIANHSPQLESIVRDQKFLEFLADVQHSKEIVVPSYIFKVNHDCNSEDTILYEARSATYGTKYAFYSCNPDTMYLLLCKGFKLYKNSMKEIYLTDKIRIALSKIPRMAGWGKSSCGPIFRVVGLCECIMRFEYLKRVIDMKFNCPSVYVEVPELLRLSYLLFYTEHLPKQQKRESIITQIFNKNYSAHITLLLVAILGYICRKRLQLTCAFIRNKIDHIPILRRIFLG